MKKIVLILIVLTIALGAGTAVVGYELYSSGLKPYGNTETQRFTVSEGDSISTVSENLQKAGLVKNALIFRTYVSKQSKSTAKVGVYDLSSSMGVKGIAEAIDSGKTATRNIQILPGQTLNEIKDHFKLLGFSDEEISSALSKKYTSEILSDKPADQGLEGYLFPDTYKVSIDATLSDVIQLSIDQLDANLKEIDFNKAMKSIGINKHQFITLSSIVQKEVSYPDDQKGVASVFINRLKAKDRLGSDVTFQYAAKQFGLPNSPDQKSPYNTRVVTGLPPGPISNFNLSAAQALVSPAGSDYYYFVAGDDGKTYYAKTNAEHEANVKKYCTKLCQ